MDAEDMTNKRVTVFAGHYGSGKTNIAVNFALRLADEKKAVSIVDLDIVNPYFRSKDSEGLLESRGVRFISSAFANSNVDTPAIPADAYSITADKGRFFAVDVGGDDRGALALGRFSDGIKEEGNYDMLFIVNKFRPLTKDADSCTEIMHEIENACDLRFTGIVNNSNLGEETTAENVLESVKFAEEVSKKTNLPLMMTTVNEKLYDSLKDKIENLMPLHLYVRQSWQKQEEDYGKGNI